MTFDPKFHHRRSIRLSSYDYSQAGMYFVTTCTQNHECLFGNIVDGKMRPNEIGRLVELMWNEITMHFQTVELDEFVIMPNHIHGIIVIGGASTTRHNQGAASSAPTLGKIMRSFKSRSAIAANKLLGRTSKPIWQRNYWERVIRHDVELRDIREYISNNPMQWHLDQLHR